jgi:Phosphotransferase enzyme family
VVPVIECEHETYRVIVLSSDGREILLAVDGDRFALLSVEIPRWQRVTENLTEAVKSGWGEKIVCLFELSELAGTHGTGIHYETARHWRTVDVPKMPTRWVPVAALFNDSLTGVANHLAIQQASELCGGGNTSPAGPFTSLGWFNELREWVEGIIQPLGFHLNGNFRQLNASPSFSLIRFETDGPALWFKAVGEPNQREFPITCELSRLFPRYVPIVLGTRPEWNGWLTREAVGKLLSDAQGNDLWEKAASALAELQIDSIDHGAQILAAGAHDLCIGELSKRVGPFIETMAQLMERQIKTPPAALNRKELLLLGDRLQTALEALETLGIPETLGHLDLNPGNIVTLPDRCVFLDWAEAYIGNPFFTFQYLLEHLRRTAGGDSALKMSLVSSYHEPWKRMVGSTAIDDALSLTPLLAAFAYTAGSDVWRDEARMQDPATAGYLRSLARRMHREANSLSERRSLCLH